MRETTPRVATSAKAAYGESVPTTDSPRGSEQQHLLPRLVLALLWLNGLRFWVFLLVVGVLFVAYGNSLGVAIGVVLLAAALPGVVGMFRS